MVQGAFHRCTCCARLPGSFTVKNSGERLAFQDLHHHCGLRSVSWCAQVSPVAARSISNVDWLGLGILAGRLSTGQQQGGNLQGQAQRPVTAAGRKAGYVWQPTDCIICCPLFVACDPLFGTTQPQDGYVWPSGCTICCPLFTSLGAFKTGISFHIESNFASCGSLAQSGT